MLFTVYILPNSIQDALEINVCAGGLLCLTSYYILQASSQVSVFILCEAFCNIGCTGFCLLVFIPVSLFLLFVACKALCNFDLGKCYTNKLYYCFSMIIMESMHCLP